MGKRKGSHRTKRKPDRVTKESSSSKLPKNDNQIEKMIELDKTTDDASVLFSHFPEEIWRMITDKVVDSDSLTNLMQASPVFRNLLLPRRVEFLFPQVWKVLGIKFEKREEEVYSYDHDGVTPYCSKILLLRLVCRSWCQGVDEFYENLPDSNHYRMSADREDAHTSNYHLSRIRVFEWINIFNYIDCRERIEGFIEHFDTTHFKTRKQRNPLIGRHVRIFHGSEGHESQVFSLLSKYGQHFWFCDLHLSDQFQSMVAYYTELRELLELMPNLKTLRVEYTEKLEQGSCRIDFENLYTSDSEIRQLKRENESQPFPKLHQLKFLSVKNFPPFLSNPLISANNHVSMLEVEHDDVHDDDEGDDIYTFPMPNLKQLSIEYFSEKEFKNLNKPEMNWPLEKLYLNFKTCTFFPWSKIFTLLEIKWATTLKHVAIHFPPYGVCSTDTYDGSTKLNLPNVQRFKLTSRQIFSLDFILPMKSLEFLEITVDEKSINEIIEKRLRLIEKNQKVQFVGYFQRFTESNIWNLFPNLQKIRFINNNNICLYNYNREECEAKRRTRSARKPITGTPKNNLWLILPVVREVVYLSLNIDEN